MLRKQVSRDHENLSSINDHFVCNYENPKHEAQQKVSKFSSSPTCSFSFGLKRPKVYAKRDFPNLCVASQVNEMPETSVNGNKEKMTASFNTSKKRKILASVKSVDAVQDRNMEPKTNVKADDDKNKVKEKLLLFRKIYKELSSKHKEGNSRRFDLNAARLLKQQGKWTARGFGHISGISIGDQFHYRAELAVVGLHCRFMNGIDYKNRGGKILATSIVDSGYYDNKSKSADVMIYSGEGGHKVFHTAGTDQKLQRGNLALANSMEEKNPVRVIKKNNLDRDQMLYVYDGLYTVNKYWRERDGTGKLVYKFELIRVSAQGTPSQTNAVETRKASYKECCVMDDVSRGNECMAIRAMNGIDGERPRLFAYATSMRYPDGWKQISQCRNGCDCIDGCSNSKQCSCVLKNGGEIQFSDKGGIMKGREIVYECGRFCKCPSSCMNRVSQHGLRYKLEVFKMKSSHTWGVRSASYMSSGSFVCEYVGNLKVTEEDGMVRIDASRLGNVGRFVMNSSSSPNLFVRRIVYDHEDDKVPHMMLFAAKNIPPMQVLTCDFNYHNMPQVAEFQYQVDVL